MSVLTLLVGSEKAWLKLLRFLQEGMLHFPLIFTTLTSNCTKNCCSCFENFWLKLQDKDILMVPFRVLLRKYSFMVLLGEAELPVLFKSNHGILEDEYLLRELRGEFKD